MAQQMNIALLTGTNRGFMFLKRLKKICPQDQITVVTFQAESFEPNFNENLEKYCLEKGIKILLRNQVVDWKSFDLMYCVSWRWKMPKEMYEAPRLGTYIFHDSCLPRYRGFSPTVWAMINGEPYAGVTLFKAASGIDDGDILDQAAVPISEGDMAEIIDRINTTYLTLLTINHLAIVEGRAILRPQNHAMATYCAKRIPSDNRIDWSKTTQEIYNFIRANSHPYTGAYCFYEGKKLFVWSAEICSYPMYCGIIGAVAEIRDTGSLVITKYGGILLKNVQQEGKESCNANQVLKKLSDRLQ